MKHSNQTYLPKLLSIALVFFLPFLLLAQQEPGTAPLDANENSSNYLSAINGLSVIYNQTGNYTISADGYGYSSTSDNNLGIEKPSDDATVVQAFIMGASRGFSNYQLQDGDVVYDGNPISWDTHIPSSISSYNAIADVTTMVQTLVSGLNAGVHYFSYSEIPPTNVEGCALLVVFEDPSFPERTISILWGALDTGGDSFTFSLAEPIDPADPDAIFDMGLGISFGNQIPPVPDQYSIVDVNGIPLTSIAGHYDDGKDLANGSLMTVGGIGDANDNPLFPDQVLVSADNFDDELYSILPLISDTDVSLTINTINPSNDDNIFLAYFEILGEAQIECPLDIAVDNDAGSCGAIVEYLVTEGSTQVEGLASGSFFPVGTTVNTFTNPECSFEVVVSDAEAPTALCQPIDVFANEDGDYEVDAAEIDDGSFDNCAVTSMSVSPSLIPCNSGMTEHIVTLIVYDAAGNSNTCETIVSLQDDSDCDGVGDACDLCPGGDDSIDNNGDGLPDCAYDPGYENVPVEWTCPNNENQQKVYVCHDGNTLCIAYAALQAHLDHGDFLGPCDNSYCIVKGLEQQIISNDALNSNEQNFMVYPNPNTGQFTLYLNEQLDQAKVSIVSYLGQTVYTNVLTEGQQYLNIQLQNSAIENGMYFMIIQKDKVIQSQRFIIE